MANPEEVTSEKLAEVKRAREEELSVAGDGTVTWAGNGRDTISAVPDDDSPGYLPFGGQLALPERYRATVEPAAGDLPVCHLTVAVEAGRPVCVDFRCERREGGPPVTGELLRKLRIGEWVREATWLVALRLVAAKDGTVRAQRLWTSDLAFGRDHYLWHGFVEDYGEATRTPRRRSPVTDEELRRVATVYRDAYVARRAPTRAVAEAMHVSRATAGRWVARARELGLLGKTRPRMAGEIEEGS